MSPVTVSLWAVGGQKSPVYLLLRGLALQHQLLVGDLQLSGRHVQLLVHLGVLLVHLPQHFQLLGQVLRSERRRKEVAGSDLHKTSVQRRHRFTPDSSCMHNTTKYKELFDLFAQSNHKNLSAGFKP